MAIKIVVVGDRAVGKTCLFISFATHHFPHDYVPTVSDIYQINCTFNNIQYEVSLWDTEHEEHDRLRSLYYPKTKLFLVCYSVINPTSFESVSEKWLPEIKYHMPETDFVIVGTKIDL
jgi:small GTP-binding protein